jgi:hypoxanthine phosphoribosyltransferase
MVPTESIQIADLHFVPFLESAQIGERIKTLAGILSQDLEGKDPILIPVLNGAFMFAADLMKAISIPCEVSFVKVASYHKGTQSSGAIHDVLGLGTDIRRRHVVLVEDIVDTGLTMEYLIQTFMAFEPASLRIAALFLKPDSLQKPIKVDYLGFEIENKFIVGYGLDYKGLGRNYKDVYQLRN